ncbi:MAG: hypothetical protein R2713_11995 [Ilumatobacteraceae bacterium]
MSIHDLPIHTLRGRTDDARFARRRRSWPSTSPRSAVSPQYTGLEALQRELGDRGLTVVGFPNQFLGQEPGTAEEIETFCSTTYGVSFR